MLKITLSNNYGELKKQAKHFLHIATEIMKANEIQRRTLEKFPEKEVKKFISEVEKEVMEELGEPMEESTSKEKDIIYVDMPKVEV